MSTQHDSPLEVSVAPGFIISGPQLQDPNFARTLVLMAQHSEEGALGFVVNRPASIGLETLLENIDTDLAKLAREAGLSDHDVLVGGPVQPTAVWLLFEQRPDEPEEDILPVGDVLAVGATRQLLEDFVSGKRPGPFHVVLGYAGWGPGQLEMETHSGAWLPLDLAEDLVFEIPFADRWSEALRRLGLPPGGFLISGPGAEA
jgi:putative transcriptional regulator